MVKIVRLTRAPFNFTRIPLLFCFGFNLWFSAACNFSEDKVDKEEEFVFSDAELHYEIVNTRIVAPYCLSCHAAASGNQGDVNLETPESLRSRIPTLERVVLVNRSMPKPGSPRLPEGALRMFSAWLRAGAPE